MERFPRAVRGRGPPLAQVPMGRRWKSLRSATLRPPRSGRRRRPPGQCPRPIETLRSQVLREYPVVSLAPRERRNQPRRVGSEPDCARSGLGVKQAGRAAVLNGQVGDLASAKIEHFGETGTSEGEQSQRRRMPGVFLTVAVEHGAEAFKLLLH